MYDEIKAKLQIMKEKYFKIVVSVNDQPGPRGNEQAITG